MVDHVFNLILILFTFSKNEKEANFGFLLSFMKDLYNEMD